MSGSLSVSVNVTLLSCSLVSSLSCQAIDDDCNQTGQMLAALLKWPQVTSTHTHTHTHTCPVLSSLHTAHWVTWPSVCRRSEFQLLLPCSFLVCTLSPPALLNHLKHVAHWRAPRCSCTGLLRSRKRLCLLRSPGRLKVLKHFLHSTRYWEAAWVLELSSHTHTHTYTHAHAHAHTHILLRWNFSSKHGIINSCLSLCD